MKIKICGITNLDDALAAIEAGADMLGFNFYPKSPRCITTEACAEIQASITNRQSSINTVGVFVNAPADEITAVLDQCGLDLAQLSGDEPVKTLAALGERAFKALRLLDPESAAEALALIPSRTSPPAYLVDAYRPGEYGGTGQTADWGLASDLAQRAPVLLAGGLTPDNVAEAVRQVHPWGVDVASGVEASPGKKDAGKVREFIRNARNMLLWETIQIERASRKDLPEILVLQKLAYRSEAELNGDFSIPPLTQTLEGMEEDYASQTFLKAVVDGQIIGSVRAYLQYGTCHIGRLIVHPDWQNRGLGSRLMKEIEGCFADVERFELFTSERSSRNLYLYQKLGYCILRRERLNEYINLVYLEKKT
jgi:phosphoribosylanthranilate isomerase